MPSLMSNVRHHGLEYQSPTGGVRASRAASLLDADESLVERMAGGDERALGLLYDHMYSVVHAVAARILRQISDVEDVVEDVFWQAWRQAGRYEHERGSVRTWLATIARSRALDRLRVSERLREVPLDDTPIHRAAHRDTEDDSAPDGDHAERFSMLRDALALLPYAQREALELGYFHGLSQTQIAARTRQPLGTVKSRVRQGMRTLRSDLAMMEG